MRLASSLLMVLRGSNQRAQNRIGTRMRKRTRTQNNANKFGVEKDRTRRRQTGFRSFACLLACFSSRRSRDNKNQLNVVIVPPGRVGWPKVRPRLKLGDGRGVKLASEAFRGPTVGSFISCSTAGESSESRGLAAVRRLVFSYERQSSSTMPRLGAASPTFAGQLRPAFSLPGSRS